MKEEEESDSVVELDSQNKVFNEALDKLEYTSAHYFITGKAGTGKSTLLKTFREQTAKEVVVLAPTGIAAINVQGSTIHSFFKFPLGPLYGSDKHIYRFPPESDTLNIIKHADTFIIDEASMIRADLIDAMDASLRKNTGNVHLAFGGKQIVFFGDLYQLPPVNTSVDEIFDRLYESPYFFDARVLRKMDLACFELQKVYRQADTEFIQLLDNIRKGEFDEFDLEKLNSRYKAKTDKNTAEDFAITICTTNKVANKINADKLLELNTPSDSYSGIIDGEFNERALPTDKELYLREEAQVMFIRNDPAGRWVNGTIGKVKALYNDTVEVELSGGNTVEVEAVEWEHKEYRYNEEEKAITTEVKGSFTQIPLKLAWAVTIHKSQGLTFERVVINLGWGTFAHGQLYVALSRSRTLEGIQLQSRIRPKDVIVDERIKTFSGD